MATGAQLVAQPGIGSVGTPLPQTTTPPRGQGPFIRYARTALRPGFTRSGDAFGAVVTNPLPSAPGYLKCLWITVQAVAGTATTATASADAPYNVIQFLQFKDPWGTPIITTDGYALAQIINPYSGQAGLLAPALPQNLPSFSAVSATTGAFTFKVCVPVEGTRGLGVMSMGNASVLPTLFIQYASSAVVYTSISGGTVPTLSITVDLEYYDVDPTNPVQPPQNGTTLQWSVAQGDQTIGQNSSTRVKLPHLGGYLTTLAFLLRDASATNARVDAFNTSGRLRIYIDGVPQRDMLWQEVIDEMFIVSGGLTRVTGLVVISFKRSLSQLNLGLLDTLEEALQCTPGTQIEVEMTPWGSGGTSPYTANIYYGQFVPAGDLQQGLIEA